MLRIGVLGAGGRMGQAVCDAVEEAEDLELVSAIDPAFATNHSVDRSATRTVPLYSDIDEVDDQGTDVLVDFTEADAARRHLRWCADHGVHAVVGTSGLSAEDLADVELRFTDSTANAVVAANFAIGAVLLMRMSELAAPFMDGVEVIELHHDAKRDAPSGTAMFTAERIAQARRDAGARDLGPDPTAQFVLEGARGGEGPGGIRVHSVRLPGLVAHEEVLFGALGQSLSIRHDSYDRRSFMPGVILAIRGVSERPGLTLGLDALLGI